MKHLITTITGIVCFGAGYFIAGTQSPAPEQYNQLTSAVQPPMMEINGEVPPQAPSKSARETTDNKGLAISQLKNQIAQLKAQLKAQSQLQVKQNNQTYIHPENTVADNNGYDDTTEPAAETDLESKISKEEAEALVPQPFSNFVSGSSGTFAKNFRNFNKEDRDYDWALQMENNIKDFISMHEFAGDIQMQGVNCKTDTCEIMGFELKDKSWSFLFNEMKLEPWWKFRGTHASSRSDDKQSYFYILTSRKM